MPGQARKTDLVKHDGPHCHMPVHPPAPTPTPLPHPPVPHLIQTATVPTVKVNNLEAAVVTSQTVNCLIAPICTAPPGPGVIAKGSTSVFIGGKPAARANDMVVFAGCVGPIPMPKATILPPCSVNVITGG